MASQMLMPLPRQQHMRVSDQQSLEIVKIFLNAAVACIAHTRELIPWKLSCFQTRQINQLQIDQTAADSIYSWFCGSSIDGTGSSESQEFRILRRGYDDRADCILDMIEYGITDALKKSFLDSFQLMVATDTRDPATVLEAYNFSIAYADGNVSQISVSSDATNFFVMNNVHRSFASSIKALLRSMSNLHRLPRHRFLGITLLYTESCPPSYQAPGFQDVEQLRQETLHTSWTDLWDGLPMAQTKFTAGNMNIKIGARPLQSGRSVGNACLRDIQLLASIESLQKPSSQAKGVIPTTDALPENASYDEAQVNHLGNDQEGQRSEIDWEIGNEERVPQSDLQQDSRRGAFKHSDIGLRRSKPSANSLADLCVIAKNRRRRNVVPIKLAELLVQARAIENCYQDLGTIFDSAQLENGRTRRLDRAFTVRCECGSDHEVEQMLLCELCGTKQHKVCYGYERLRLGCLPEEHVCYDCLLLPGEVQINQSMPGIVHMRLAIQYLARQPTCEVHIDETFLQAVFSDHKDSALVFMKVVDRLTEEGYLGQRTDGVALILNNDKSAEAQTAYLDPLVGISHHYQIVKDGDTFEKRKKELLKALKLYVGDRAFSLQDVCNSHYDQVHVKNNRGQPVVRWGFYATLKRKRSDTAKEAALRQKVSMSNNFISIHRSTPSEATTLDDATPSATNEAEWELR